MAIAMEIDLSKIQGEIPDAVHGLPVDNTRKALANTQLSKWITQQETVNSRLTAKVARKDAAIVQTANRIRKSRHLC